MNGPVPRYRTPLVLLALTCVLFAVSGLVSMSFSSVENARGTTGEVVEVNVTRSGGPGRDRSMYAPVIEYRVDGEPYTLVSALSTSDRVAEGDVVEVMYNTEDPSDARWDNAASSNMTWASIGLGVVGLVVCALAAFTRVFRTRTSFTRAAVITPDSPLE